MAAPVKKREIERNLHDDDEDDVSSSSEDEEYEVADEQGMELQLDFEGRNPQDPDYHGIKTLLKQLFLKARIDLGGLTDLIISQNYVGSVVKQSEEIDESDDDDDSDINDVFGITTVINVSDRQNTSCIQQLRDLLKQLADEHATDAANAMIKNVLENDAAQLGLLINERFVNIPAKISVPLLENLISEVKRANNKNMPFNFSYYVLICKLYKSEDKKTNKKSKNKNRKTGNEPSILWSNPEEEIFAENATVSFEFSVEEEADSGLSGTWTESDDEMIPYRRVLLFEAPKLQSIFEKIQNQFS
ncbi:protein BCCIP homolog [Nylanderia fulva]|uniref:protein BCCIP homolog n=1 Tax=Nylanderia fulva TaxID=613905 RepID=UPI0010FADE5B|nr:protein BCCIP homolog [Nylanderia fulva]